MYPQSINNQIKHIVSTPKAMKQTLPDVNSCITVGQGGSSPQLKNANQQ